ncbi:MAG: YceI family protein [Ferruginibacter sp.]|nr:YceI family protein [Cytophagales bacterium]
MKGARAAFRTLFVFGWLLAGHLPAAAQRYVAERSRVGFFSATPLENIEAVTDQATSLFDAATGQVAFAVPVKSFQFAKSLMREHFNESYLESDRYPKATFGGKVTGFVNQPGKQRVTATGDLFLHGVTRTVTVEGMMEVREGKIVLDAVFPVKLADYRVKVPTVVFYNVAELIEVKVNFAYKPYEKQ